MAFGLRGLTVLIVVAFIAAGCAQDADQEPDTIPPDTTPPASDGPVQSGDLVSVEYTGSFPNGTVFDTSEGQAPLQFQVGAGQLIPGFENQILGMVVGESKQFTLQPEEAYGEYDPSLVVQEEVPAENLGEDMTQYVGENIVLQNEMGMPVPVFVVSADEEVVTLDIDQNHPLAGETLVFDVTLTGIDEAPPQPALPIGEEMPPLPIE
ncbi:MAG: FKBP-type peptidyl-prolyl cis-trans isomerase [Candidatus Woesearchaeota archaeon]